MNNFGSGLFDCEHCCTSARIDFKIYEGVGTAIVHQCWKMLGEPGMFIKRPNPRFSGEKHRHVHLLTLEPGSFEWMRHMLPVYQAPHGVLGQFKPYENEADFKFDGLFPADGSSRSAGWAAILERRERLLRMNGDVEDYADSEDSDWGD